MCFKNIKICTPSATAFLEFGLYLMKYINLHFPLRISFFFIQLTPFGINSFGSLWGQAEFFRLTDYIAKQRLRLAPPIAFIFSLNCCKIFCVYPFCSNFWVDRCWIREDLPHDILYTLFFIFVYYNIFFVNLSYGSGSLCFLPNSAII